MKLVELDKITKKFSIKGNDITVLQDISMEINGSNIIGIWGPSGAGKTTLLQIIGTLEKPTSGKIYFENKDITNYDEEEMSRFRSDFIGFIFQFHNLLPEFTALENVIVPLLIKGYNMKESKEKAEFLLEKVELSDRINHKPAELSGGEQQRVAVARALITSPKIVLADEPTGNLDSVTGEKVYDLMLELNKEFNTSLIVATHSRKLIEKMDTVLEIVDGKIVESFFNN